MIGYFLIGCLGLVAIIVILRARYPIHITMTCDGVRRATGISDTIKARIHQFATEVLEPGQIVTCKGYPVGRGNIRWVFPKKTDPEIGQRFRNWFVNDLF